MGAGSTMMGGGIQGQSWAAKHAAAQPQGNTLGWAPGTGPGANTGTYRTSGGTNQFGGPPAGGWGTSAPPPVTGGAGQGGPWGGTPNVGAPGTVGPITGPGPATKPAWMGYAGGIVGVGRGIPR